MRELLRIGAPPRNALPQWPRSPLTRFAPSVTGSLHLGHVANAVWTWAIAGALGGRVLLRLEDHDRGRFRPEHEAAILDEIEWLGLEPDEPSLATFRAGPCEYRQSDHDERYRLASQRLATVARLYACACTRRQVLARTGDASGTAAGAASGGELVYDGHCRERGLVEEEGLGLRVELPDESVDFVDALAGPRRQHPARQCGDLLVRDRDGCWTYQFCVAVDDLHEGVELVVRGFDLLASTGRQVLLARMLGRERPATFAHHPLIGEPDGRKLSKSEGDACVAAWRAAGRAPADMLGLAAFLTGLIPEERFLEPARLAAAGLEFLGRP